jgi:hypothetical protein
MRVATAAGALCSWFGTGRKCYLSDAPATEGRHAALQAAAPASADLLQDDRLLVRRGEVYERGVNLVSVENFGGSG